MAEQFSNAPKGHGWISGLVVMVAVAVAYVGFARVSVGWTLLIATGILIGLVLFLWRVGARKQREG